MDTLLNIPSELAELAAIEAESIGWLPLGEEAYLHIGKPEDGQPEEGHKKDTHFSCLKINQRFKD